MKQPLRITSSLALAVLPALVFGQEADVRKVDYSVGLELKAHYRKSKDVGFVSGLAPGDPLLPPAFQASGFPGGEMRTVDPGSHYEVSVVSLLGRLSYEDTFRFNTKIDIIDIHDRNPTSEDKDIDVDEFQLLFGKDVPEHKLADGEGRNAYLRLGKFGKMERQDDRHLESYGVVSTAFNRFEDQGLEAGIDLTPNLYVKGSYTAGNPVFIRDPNALAGDNGTADSLKGTPKKNAGIPILYDAEVEDLDFDQNVAEWGGALGYRAGSEDGSTVVNVMGFYYERDLAESVKLEGTKYGADLDVLDTPGPATLKDGEISIRGDGNSKEEMGANVWLYLNDTTIFAQYVEQDIGGLERTGWEVEASHFIGLPSFLSIGDTQIIRDISPSIRYSELDCHFRGPAYFPAASVFWDWEKIDVGARVGVVEGLDFTFEWSLNEFERKGRGVTMDEFLATLRWTYTL